MNVFDLDSNGNIAIGGQTSATTLTSTANSVFLAMISETSHHFTWARYLSISDGTSTLN